MERVHLRGRTLGGARNGKHTGKSPRPPRPLGHDRSTRGLPRHTHTHLVQGPPGTGKTWMLVMTYLLCYHCHIMPFVYTAATNQCLHQLALDIQKMIPRDAPAGQGCIRLPAYFLSSTGKQITGLDVPIGSVAPHMDAPSLIIGTLSMLIKLSQAPAGFQPGTAKVLIVDEAQGGLREPRGAVADGQLREHCCRRPSSTMRYTSTGSCCVVPAEMQG